MSTAVQFFEFSYTLTDLQRLRGCMRCNSGAAGALRAFMYSDAPESFPWIPYLEFYDKIKENENWPEEHFAQTQNHKFSTEPTP